MRWYSNMSGNGGFFTKNERTNEIQRRDRADGRRTDIGLRVHEAPHPQDSAGMLQLRRVHSGRGRPYRAADQPGVHRPEHVQPAGAAARQLDAEPSTCLREERSVRLHILQRIVQTWANPTCSTFAKISTGAPPALSLFGVADSVFSKDISTAVSTRDSFGASTPSSRGAAIPIRCCAIIKQHRRMR